MDLADGVVQLRTSEHEVQGVKEHLDFEVKHFDELQVSDDAHDTLCPFLLIREQWRSWHLPWRVSSRPGVTRECRRAFQGKDVDKIRMFERKQVLAILRNLEYSKADV